MKTTIKNTAQKEAFIKVIQNTEIKSNYKAEFSKVRRKRSLSQNSYLWLLLTIGEQETGNLKADLYSYFLSRYPVTKEVDICDEICIVQVTSSGFNSLQMSIFIEHIRRDLAEMGIATPDAGSDAAVDCWNYYHENGLI